MLDKLKIAAGYVRCSTEQQDDSIDQQKREISKWADQGGYKVIRWFEDEGKSGTSFEKRPAFVEMKNRVECDPGFEYVLVYDESRWGRAKRIRESSYWKVHFEKRGVKVVITNSGSNSGNNVGDFVIEAVESAEATEYSKKLSRSVLRGSKANASKGYSSGGTAPYGFNRLAVNKVTGKKRLLDDGHRAIPKEEKVKFVLGDQFEINIVNEIFTKRCAGLGYRRIAEYLNSNDIPCPKRGRWKNKDQKWSIGTIRTIVNNRAYCGDMVYNKHPQSHLTYEDGKKCWINTEENQTILENAHPEIVSRKMFNKANETAGKFVGGARFKAQSPYLLSGLIKCDHCGFNFQGSSYKNDGLSYYIDGGYKNKGKSVCDSYKIPLEQIEGYALKTIKDTICKSDIESLIIKTIQKQLSGKSIQSTNKYSRINESINIENVKKERLLDALETGGDNNESIINRIREKESKIEYLENELVKFQAMIFNDSDVQTLTTKINELVRDFDKVMKHATTQEKKNVLSLFIDHVQIKRKSNEAVFYINKLPTAHKKLDMSFLSVSSVAEEGLEPPTRGL